MEIGAGNSEEHTTPELEQRLIEAKEKEFLVEEFSWSQLEVRLKSTKKVILNNNTGSIKSGEIVAFIGASGAGKTTLLNALAGKLQKTSVSFKGKISWLGGEVKSRKIVKSISSYLQQDDVFLNNLTPREIIKFTMDLQSSSREEVKLSTMNQILQDLNLDKCSDLKIGDFEQKGLSGGEKRRLSLALELIKRPKILFADEPTSGLDSFSAYLITKILRKHAE